MASTIHFVIVKIPINKIISQTGTNRLVIWDKYCTDIIIKRTQKQHTQIKSKHSPIAKDDASMLEGKLLSLSEVSGDTLMPCLVFTCKAGIQLDEARADSHT